MKECESWQKLISAVIYGDIFDCAVTLKEICKYSRSALDSRKLDKLLDGFVVQGIICQHDKFYYLPGRRELALERSKHMRRAERLKRRARRVARWLRHLPFIRGIYLTGSVAAGCAGPDADIDLLIVVREGRLGFVFMQLGPLSRIVSRRMFCPNYYICEQHLAIDHHSHYVARELVQAEPLVSDNNPLIAANTWASRQLPNCSPHQGSDACPPGSRLQTILEFPFRGWLGDALDAVSRWVARRRLVQHYREHGCEIPESVRDEFECGKELRFHASAKIERLSSAYEMRCRSLEAAFARIQDTDAKNAL